MKNLLAGLFGLALAVALVPSVALAAEDTSSSARAAPETVLVAEGETSASAATEGEEAAISDPTEVSVSTEDEVAAITAEDFEKQADVQIVDEGGAASAVAEDGTAIAVGKDIEATGVENYFENYFDITLTVEASEEPVDNSTAVVLVMDVSNTMNEVMAEGAASGSTRLSNAQAAANSFVQQYCEGEGLSENRMLGVVIFNTNAQWADGLRLQAVSSSSSSSLQASISAITAPSTPTEVRFTNMEAGLRLAYNALAELQVAHRYLIFVTDGFPTTYIDRTIDGNFTSDVSIEGYDPYQQGVYVATNVGEDGYFADAVLGLPCTYGTSYSDKAAQRAAEAATALKDGDEGAGLSGVNIFSIGIDIGGQTIDYYVSRATGTFSIVDRISDSYVIGDGSDADSYRDWLTTAIAGGPSMTDDSSRYADGDSAEELQVAFDDILADIKATSGMPLREAVVVDPMGSDVEFMYFFDENGDPADLLTGSNGESTEENLLGNTATFDESLRSIMWDLMQSGYSVTVSESGARMYGYQLKYRVRLMNEAPGFAFGASVLTNDGAHLEYKTLDRNGELVENDAVLLPDPAVQGFEGAFEISKVDAESGKPVSGALFELSHSDDCAMCAAGSHVSVDLQQQVSDERGYARFGGLPSGHEYVLVEIQPAEGYLVLDERFNVRVAYGQTTVSNAADGQLLLADAVDGVLRVANEPIEVPPGPEPVVPDEPVKPGNLAPASVLPQTGDSAVNAVMMLLCMLIAVAVAGISCVMVAERGTRKRA